MSFYPPSYTKCHVASHQQTDSQQVGGSVCFEETVQSWGFLPGGGFPPPCVTLHEAWMCLSVPAYAYVCHKGKRALRPAVPVLPRGCLLTVPFTSQHVPGRWI